MISLTTGGLVNAKLTVSTPDRMDSSGSKVAVVDVFLDGVPLGVVDMPGEALEIADFPFGEAFGEPALSCRVIILGRGFWARFAGGERRGDLPSPEVTRCRKGGLAGVIGSDTVRAMLCLRVRAEETGAMG